MEHIGHYHEARLLQIEDIDGQIQRLNTISRQRAFPSTAGAWYE